MFDGSKQHSVPAPASTAFVEEDEICVEHIEQVESAGISIFDEDPSEAKNVDDDDLFRKTTSNSDETYDLDAELNMFGWGKSLCNFEFVFLTKVTYSSLGKK